MTKNFWVVALVLLVAAGCKPQGNGAKTPAEAAEAAAKKVQAEMLTWNKATTVGEYDKHGTHNPEWDSQAKQALELYAQVRAGSTNVSGLEQDLHQTLKRLTEAKCDDPLIQYLALRSEVNAGEKSNEELAGDFRQAADRLTASEYAPVRKFYGAFRAAQSSEYINKETPREFYPYRDQVLVFLEQVVRDRSIPAEEVYQVLHNVIYARFWTPKGLNGLDKIVNKTLFEARPVTALSYLARAEHETEYGWLMRGGGFVDTVTEEGWRGFAQHLRLASAALQKAWDLDQTDPRIPTMMLTIVRGKQDNRDTMEKWFKRAMDLNPYNYAAYSAKLEYLQPKWYGSPEELLAFGRECVESSTWKGEIPLIMVDAHYALSTYIEKSQRSEYWKNPEVWPDIKAAYEKFFQLNPEAYSYRHGYARYAWLCQQWDDLNKQLPLMVYTNYAYFGGREEFEKIVKDAQEHESQPSKEDPGESK